MSAISGTSMIVPRPSLFASAIARRYTSVLPEPVTPWSRNVVAALLGRERGGERVHRDLLRVGRRELGVAEDRLDEERIADRVALLDRDEALLLELLHRGACAAELLLEARERKRTVRAEIGEETRRRPP